MSNGQRPTYWINSENVVLHCTSGFLMGLMLMGFDGFLLIFWRYPNFKNVRSSILSSHDNNNNNKNNY